MINDLKKKIAVAGWLPGKRDMADVLAAWPDLNETEQDRLEKILAKLDQLAVSRWLQLWSQQDVRTRGELARSLGRSIFKNQHPESIDWLMEQLPKEVDARTRKGWIQSIGSALQENTSVKRPELVSVLLQALERPELEAPEIKALSDALGKSGDTRARFALAALQERGANTQRSQMILERDLVRSQETETSSIDFMQAMDGPNAFTGEIVAWFIPGVERVASRLTAFAGADRLADGMLLVSDPNPTALRDSLLWLELGFVLKRLRQNDVSSKTIAEIICDHAVKLRAVTSLKNPESPVRVRMGRDVAGGRAEIWQFAENLAERKCGVICDGRAAPWDIRLVADPGSDKILLCLVPKTFVDPRWQWRNNEETIEGASQSTLAAALVHLAGINPKDRVWDPFCGAGTELMIAGTSGASDLTLVGTDTNPQAVELAKAAAHRLNLKVDVRKADALTMTESFDVIVTNPPFGMRTARGEARGILEEFFARVRSRLNRGGRFVLLSHAPAATAVWAKDSGLKLSESLPLKLGGMTCELQRFE